MNFFKKTFSFLRKPTVIIIIIVLIVTVFFVFRNNNNSVSEAIVTLRDISEIVSASGKTKALQSVNLGFEKSGVVSKVFVSVGEVVKAGQVLVSLDKSELSAELLQAQSSYDSERAKLADDAKNSETRFVKAEALFAEAKNGLEDQIRNTYTKSDEAVRGHTDQFFSNPRSYNPTFGLVPKDRFIVEDVESERYLSEKSINQIFSLSKSDLSDPVLVAQQVKSELDIIKKFLDNLSLAVSALTISDGYTQTELDSYNLEVSTARTIINTAISSLSTAVEKYKTSISDLILAQNDFNSSRLGDTPDVSSQQAKVNQSLAQVQGVMAQISKNILISPIDGVVTKQDSKVGEIVSPGIALVSVMSANDFEVEAFIPEVRIGKVSIGNEASITLDAFPGEIFNGKVSYIDPAETIIDGVSNFKIKVSIENKDNKLRNGLTCDIDIKTSEKKSVLSLPGFSIFGDGNNLFVKKISGNNVQNIPVIIGLRGTDGFFEIISPELNQGDIVSTK